MSIEPVRYDFKNREATENGHIGFIAQDVHQLFPEMVTTGETGDEYWGVNYAGFSVVAIKAIQQQQEIIETQADLTFVSAISNTLQRRLHGHRFRPSNRTHLRRGRRADCAAVAPSKSTTRNTACRCPKPCAAGAAFFRGDPGP